MDKHAEQSDRAEPCPHFNETGYDGCKNRHQCWEPCGELGHSEEHAKQASHEHTKAVNDALGLPKARAGEQDDFKSVAMRIYHADDDGKSAWDVANIRELAMMRKVWRFFREAIAKKDAALKACVEALKLARQTINDLNSAYGSDEIQQVADVCDAAITQAQEARK